MGAEPARAAKGGQLFGGALSVEALDSSATVLRHLRGDARQTTGLQQWFTAPEAAGFISRVTGTAGNVLDPTAGAGDLLRPWREQERHGVELDPDHTTGCYYAAITGDLQHVYPLLRTARLSFDVVVMNPPFGLDWTDTAGKTVNSTLLTLRYGMALMASDGEGALITGLSRWRREIAGTPEAAGAYALVQVPDLFDGVQIETAIVFLARPELRTDPGAKILELTSTRSGLAADHELVERVQRARREHFGWQVGNTHLREHRRMSLREAFRAVQGEHERRLGQRQRAAAFDVMLSGGKVSLHLTAFAQVALAARGDLEAVRRLQHQRPSYFALNGRDWRLLTRAREEGAISLDPALEEAVAGARHKAERALVPMYPLPAQMRLGWLDQDGDGQEQILCVTDDPARGFVAGEHYPVRADSKIHREDGERVELDKDGEPVVRRFRRERKLMQIHIGGHEFEESADDINYIIAHFAVPDPGDIGANFPEDLARATTCLEQIAREHGFAFRRFQLEDTARLALKGRGMAALEVGLGKTLVAMALAVAHVRLHGMPDLCLYLTPQDLIPQYRREAAKFFGKDMEVIRTPADARRVAARVAAGEAGWFIAPYETLSTIGRKVEPLPERYIVSPREFYRLPAVHRAQCVKCEKLIGQEQQEEDPARILLSSPTTAENCPVCLADRDTGWDGTRCAECGYVHLRVRTKSAAKALGQVFAKGMIALDEVSLIASSAGSATWSLRTAGTLALRARYRYGFSGTPLRNYVSDLFYQFAWIFGESENFPYDIASGRQKWIRDFAVVEYLYGKREGDRHKVTRTKTLPEVSNLSQLWKVLCSGTVRRRKEDTGEPLVERVLHEVRVPAGVRQLRQHKRWLEGFPDFFMERHPDHALTEAGRGVVEKFAAALGMLWKMEYAATLPEADPDAGWTGVAGVSNWTPKTLKTLELALEHARAGKKVVIFSDLVDTGVFLAERLRERGVRAIHITEERQGKRVTKNPRRRAEDIERFTHGSAQVLCVGINAVRLGHNFSMAQVAIINGCEWSFEKVEQALGRVHRLTSALPVDVYVVLANGTIDEKKYELVMDKGATSDLALDGRLIEEKVEEVDWAAVLRAMQEAGVTASGEEVDEDEVRAIWERAEGPFRDLRERPAPVPAPDPGQGVLIPFPARPLPEAPPGLFPEWDELVVEEASGQIALAV